MSQVDQNFVVETLVNCKKNINYTLKHLYERVKIYNEEQFDYKIYKINLE